VYLRGYEFKPTLFPSLNGKESKRNLLIRSMNQLRLQLLERLKEASEEELLQVARLLPLGKRLRVLPSLVFTVTSFGEEGKKVKYSYQPFQTSYQLEKEEVRKTPVGYQEELSPLTRRGGRFSFKGYSSKRGGGTQLRFLDEVSQRELFLKVKNPDFLRNRKAYLLQEPLPESYKGLVVGLVLQGSDDEDQGFQLEIHEWDTETEDFHFLQEVVRVQGSLHNFRFGLAGNQGNSVFLIIRQGGWEAWSRSNGGLFVKFHEERTKEGHYYDPFGTSEPFEARRQVVGWLVEETFDLPRVLVEEMVGFL